MNQPECTYESQILESIRTGDLPDGLAQHVTTCASCRELMVICRSLTSVADRTELPISLPNHRLIWLKAQVIKRQERTARLEFLSRVGAVAAVCLAVVVTLCWHWFGPSMDQTSSVAVDWSRMLMNAAPMIIALALVVIVTSIRPRARNRWF